MVGPRWWGSLQGSPSRDRSLVYTQECIRSASSEARCCQLVRPGRQNCKCQRLKRSTTLCGYPCDNLIVIFFGEQDLERFGASALRRQLYQCLLAQVPQSECASAGVIGVFTGLAYGSCVAGSLDEAFDRVVQRTKLLGPADMATQRRLAHWRVRL